MQGVDGHIDAKTSYEVPFFIWLNPVWQQQNPDKYQLLQAKQTLAMHTGDLFDSITDLAGIHFTSQELSRSLVSTGYQAHQRIVKAAESELDYDASVTGEGCHLQPLKK